MSSTAEAVERAAASVKAALRQLDGDPSRDPSAIGEAMAPLVERYREVFEAGAVRPSAVMAESRLVYEDPELILFLSRADAGAEETLHNHGLWNVLVMCAGSMHFRWCERLDDGSQPGKSQLGVVDDRVIRTADVGAVGLPPNDIHSFAVLEDDTWLYTVAPGAANETRETHDLESGTYVERPLGRPG